MYYGYGDHTNHLRIGFIHFVCVCLLTPSHPSLLDSVTPPLAQHMTQFSTHADDRSEAIANFEQIRRALRNTPYNKYLRPVVRKKGSVANRGEVVLD
jgi:hypothetical protein